MKVIAVIVTYNRLALLKRGIAAVQAQTAPCDIFVINNSSTDGTTEWLDAQEGLTVIHQANLGGAGGFFTGMKAAYEAGAEWVWCMDDDTIPEPEALEAMLSRPKALDESTGFLASRVVWEDGSQHKLNKQALHNDPDSATLLLEEQTVRVQFSTFVSTLIHRRAIRACGLPIKEFFIWGEDMEYTIRILKNSFCGYMVYNSVALHATVENMGVDAESISLKAIFKHSCDMRNGLYRALHIDGPWILRIPKAVVFLTKRSNVIWRKLPPLMAIKLILWLCWSCVSFRPKVVREMPEIKGAKPHLEAERA